MDVLLNEKNCVCVCVGGGWEEVRMCRCVCVRVY